MGSNYSGQLGRKIGLYTSTLDYLHAESDERIGLDAVTTRSSIPFQSGSVMKVNEIVSIACGNKHSLFSTSNGVVYVCGDNSYGQLGLSAQEIRKVQPHSSTYNKTGKDDTAAHQIRCFT
uniref:Uncharacterized protein n=1 Tax=Lygus hesperus TaxID=30085 RepID=A0A0A9Y2W6_LYGHE